MRLGIVTPLMKRIEARFQAEESRAQREARAAWRWRHEPKVNWAAYREVRELRLVRMKLKELRSLSELILREVAERHGISLAELRGPCRKRPFFEARSEAAYRLKMAGCSYPRIGRLLGNRDHTSAFHAVKKYAARNGLAEP